jgi:hypothetical protein
LYSIQKIAKIFFVELRMTMFTNQKNFRDTFEKKSQKNHHLPSSSKAISYMHSWWCDVPTVVGSSVTASVPSHSNKRERFAQISDTIWPSYDIIWLSYDTFWLSYDKIFYHTTAKTYHTTAKSYQISGQTVLHLSGKARWLQSFSYDTTVGLSTGTGFRRSM